MRIPALPSKILSATALALLALPPAASAHGAITGTGPIAGSCVAMPMRHKISLPFGETPPPHGLPGMPLPPRFAELKLSDAQQDKLFDLMHGAAPALREKGKAAARTMEALHRLSASGHYDAAQARVLADAHAKALAEMALLRADTDARMREILTVEQRKQMDEAKTRGNACAERIGKHL